MSLVEDLELNDVRVEFVADYVLKTMKLKPDKWAKMYSVEETRQMIMDFFDKNDVLQLLIASNAAGTLSVSHDWPSQLRNKSCYFVKKGKETITKDAPLRTALLYGDLSVPMDQLSAFVDEVLVPLLSNDRNHDQWPQVVSSDVQRHVHNLKSSVYVVSGQVKGKTLLPLPVGTDKVEQSALEAEEDKPEVYDRQLVHAIESVIIDWTHQIRDVLKKDSAQPLLEGLNPGPMVEIEFWKAKAQNLECIYDQLRDPKVRKMAEMLERCESSYFPAFKSIFREVVAALTEAQDINLHLKPLENHFLDLEQAEFDGENSIDKMLPPLMHIICLVWANSSYYNQPARIVVLLRETCNLLIDTCRTYLEPTEIFKGEVEETIEKVAIAKKVLKLFKDTYEEHRAKIKDYFKNGDAKEWEFTPQLVFEHYDKFLQRVETVHELFETWMEFMKLEKIEIGGIKGKALSNWTLQIFDKFNERYKDFTEVTYDPLDPELEEFVVDYQSFKEFIRDLDRKLASIVCQAFDDCSGLEAVYKLTDIFGSLLERELIKEDFDVNYPKIVAMMDKELSMAKEIYDNYMEARQEQGRMPLHKNMSKVSGSMKWAQELKDRICAPMVNFKHIEHPCMESEEAKDVFDHHEKMLRLLEAFEEEVYKEWTGGVEEACKFNIDQPLLTRNEETKYIKVNFDDQLVAVLREVRYLEIRGQDNIPDSAADMYSKNDTFRQYNASLDLTVFWYNKVRQTVLEVEFPLVEGQLEEIDVQLERAEKDLNWSNESLPEYIEETKKKKVPTATLR